MSEAQMLKFESAEDAQKMVEQNDFLVYVLAFESTDDEASQLMINVIEKLKNAYNMCKFIRIMTSPDNVLVKKYNVKKIPTYVLIKNNKMVSFLQGLVPGELTSEVRKLVTYPTEEPLPYTEGYFIKLITQQPIMLFMKGSPIAPRCGFSRDIVKILNSLGVPYGHFDILTDEHVRQGLKEFSNWPTYPQLYYDGNLIGGLDIVREYSESGELKKLLGVEEGSN